jgi:hypothetical protein
MDQLMPGLPKITASMEGMAACHTVNKCRLPAHCPGKKQAGAPLRAQIVVTGFRVLLTPLACIRAGDAATIEDGTQAPELAQ